MLFNQINQHAGIEGTGASAHRQPFHGGEAHGAGGALAIVHGAHAGPIAEMRDDHATGRRGAHEVRQIAGNELIGQPMEPVATHAFFPVDLRQGEQLGQFRLNVVEGGIKAAHLR